MGREEIYERARGRRPGVTGLVETPGIRDGAQQRVVIVGSAGLVMGYAER